MKDYSLSLYIDRNSYLLFHPTPVNSNHRGFFNTSTRFYELMVFKKKGLYKSQQICNIFISYLKESMCLFLNQTLKFFTQSFVEFGKVILKKENVKVKVYRWR